MSVERSLRCAFVALLKSKAQRAGSTPERNKRETFRAPCNASNAIDAMNAINAPTLKKAENNP
jgi:hypothetical protein